MTVVEQIKGSDTLAAHLNGQDGVIVIALPGTFDAAELVEAKPSLRRLLMRKPNAKCAERARLVLVGAAFDRIQSAYELAGLPGTTVTADEAALQECLESTWLRSRTDASAACGFIEALDRWERAVTDSIRATHP